MRTILALIAATIAMTAVTAFAAPNIDMVFVKGGCYQMGDTFGNGSTNEKPVHQVCVSDFYMGKYPVTQSQYYEVMGTNPSEFKQCGGNCPVENVNWEDAQEFIRRLNDKTGRNYRLPYEAEWEYAARSGGKQEKWAGTSDRDELGAYTWIKDNSGETTHPVGTRRPNGLGLYDMSSNVFEWCKDWYGEYDEKSPQKNPTGPLSGSERVMRGARWDFTAGAVRVAGRFFGIPSYRGYGSGFRLVLPPVQRAQPRKSLQATGR